MQEFEISANRSTIPSTIPPESYFSDDEAASRRNLRNLAWHSLTAMLLAMAILIPIHLFLYAGTPRSSDGLSYIVVARNIEEGRGIVSDVVQPGLMTIVSTSSSGQAFVIQQPLWPILLSLWFRLFGPTATSALVLEYALTVGTAVACWWLAFLCSGKRWVGYLAIVMLMSNPIYLGEVMGITTTPLQALLVCSVLILYWFPVRPWSVILIGILLAAGLLTRENSIFLIVGLALCWYDQLQHSSGLRNKRNKLEGV